VADEAQKAWARKAPLAAAKYQRTLQPVRYVGCWTIGGDDPSEGISVYQTTRPSWLHRFLNAHLLGIRWFDEPREGVIYRG